MTVIDVHAHVIPPVLVERMRAGTAPDGIELDEGGAQPFVVHRQGYRYPLLDAFHDVEARIRQMDEHGIDVSLISPAPPLFLYWTDVAGASEAAATINDAVAEMVARRPNRFAGLATLPLQDPSAAVDELRRSVLTLGLRGAQVGPHVEGTPLDSPALRPVLEAAQELHVPLVVHPYYVGSSPGLDDFYLTNLQGNPFQTAVFASRMIFSGALDELPDLDLVLVHGGGHLPFQIGRLDHGHRVRPEDGLPKMAPHDYLRRFHFDSLTHSTRSTRWLVDLVGADRVLFGTDLPFDMAGGAFDAQLAEVQDAEALALIAGGNADVLFNLGKGAERG